MYKKQPPELLHPLASLNRLNRQWRQQTLPTLTSLRTWGIYLVTLRRYTCPSNVLGAWVRLRPVFETLRTFGRGFTPRTYHVCSPLCICPQRSLLFSPRPRLRPPCRPKLSHSDRSCGSATAPASGAHLDRRRYVEVLDPTPLGRAICA